MVASSLAKVLGTIAIGKGGESGKGGSWRISWGMTGDWALEIEGEKWVICEVKYVGMQIWICMGVPEKASVFQWGDSGEGAISGSLKTRFTYVLQ